VASRRARHAAAPAACGQAPLAALIQARLPAYYPGERHAGTTVHEIPHGLPTLNDIRLFELRADRGHRQLLLSKRLRPGHEPGLIEREFRTLTAVHRQHGAGGHFGVPRPLDYFPECETLLMERVHGEPLYDAVARLTTLLFFRGDRRRCASLLARCGRILRSFHDDAPPLAPQAFGGALAEELFEKTLAALEYLEQRRALVPAQIRAVRGAMLRAQRLLASREVRVVRQHGDYFMRNILLHGDELTLVDFTFSMTNTIHHDLSTFLTRLGKMSPYPRHPFFNHFAKGGYRRAFLCGYFGSERVPDAERGLLALWDMRNYVIDLRCRHERYAAAGLKGRAFLLLLRAGHARLIARALPAVERFA
jgi:aminoglycoside phosphotransferase (APT) family kinase protein